MRKALLLGAVLSMLAIAPASAQSLTQFLQSANLDPLAQSPKILNLEAQSSSKTAQADVNAFDDFFLINGPGKLVVNFDKQLQNKGEVPIRGWIGGEGAVQDAERPGRPRRRVQDHQHAAARLRLRGAEGPGRTELPGISVHPGDQTLPARGNDRLLLDPRGLPAAAYRRRQARQLVS